MRLVQLLKEVLQGRALFLPPYGTPLEAAVAMRRGAEASRPCKTPSSGAEAMRQQVIDLLQHHLTYYRVRCKDAKADVCEDLLQSVRALPGLP